jgi:hypothetical protein
MPAKIIKGWTTPSTKYIHIFRIMPNGTDVISMCGHVKTTKDKVKTSGGRSNCTKCM